MQRALAASPAGLPGAGEDAIDGVEPMLPELLPAACRRGADWRPCAGRGRVAGLSRFAAPFFFLFFS